MIPWSLPSSEGVWRMGETTTAGNYSWRLIINICRFESVNIACIGMFIYKKIIMTSTHNKAPQKTHDRIKQRAMASIIRHSQYTGNLIEWTKSDRRQADMGKEKALEKFTKRQKNDEVSVHKKVSKSSFGVKLSPRRNRGSSSIQSVEMRHECLMQILNKTIVMD